MLVSVRVLPLQIDAWAQSNSIPGQFTGSTGAQILSSDELTNSGPQAWIRKVQVTQALLLSSTWQQCRIATCRTSAIPCGRACAQCSRLGSAPSWVSQRGVTTEAQPATDRTLLVLLCCQWQILPAPLALRHLGQALILLLWKSTVFGIGFSKPSPKLPLCLPWFSLVAPLPLSGSPGFSGSQRCGVFEAGVAVNKLLSL